MTKNAELAARVMAHIEHLAAHPGPDRWNQGTFGFRNDCGTTACFAGWTVVLADGPTGFDRTAADGDVAWRACELLGRLRVTVESVFGELPAVPTAGT